MFEYSSYAYILPDHQLEHIIIIIIIYTARPPARTHNYYNNYIYTARPPARTHNYYNNYIYTARPPARTHNYYNNYIYTARPPARTCTDNKSIIVHIEVMY